MTSSQTYYEVLEVAQTATLDEIKSAYRRLQKKWHIDKWTGMKASAEAQGADAEELERFDLMISQAETMLREINEAYEVLSDADKRRQYDNAQKQPSQSATFVPPNISITPTKLNFGKLKHGGSFSLSFVISNTGGPVLGDISLDWKKGITWAKMDFIAADPDIFPITVKVVVNTAEAYVGTNTAIIIFEAGPQKFEVPVNLEVEMPVVTTPVSNGGSTSTKSTSIPTPATQTTRQSAKINPRKSSKYLYWGIATIMFIVFVLLGTVYQHNQRSIVIWLGQNLHSNRVLLRENVGGTQCPQWSPDGTVFAYKSGGQTENYPLAFASSETGELVFEVELGLLTGYNHYFSPSGSYFAFVSESDNSDTSEEVTVGVVSLELQRIVDTVLVQREGSRYLNYSAFWSEDERFLVLQSDSDEFKVRLMGGQLHFDGTQITEAETLLIAPRTRDRSNPSNVQVIDAECVAGSSHTSAITYVSYDNNLYFYKP